MKRLCILIFISVVSPAVLSAQSTLNFPRLFTTGDMSTTGFAVLNPGASDAVVVFTLYDANGQPRGTSQQTIRARSQLARLGSELFPGVTTSGWVQGTSSVTGLVGFWLGGDFSTVTDGATAAGGFTNHVIPVVGNDEINVANSGTQTVIASFEVYDSSGGALAQNAFHVLAPKAVLQRTVQELFPSIVVSRAAQIRVNCTFPFSVTTVLRNFTANPSWAVVNSTDTSVVVSSLYIPHAISGSVGTASYSTMVNVANLDSRSQTLTLRFTRDDGTAPITIQRQIAGNGTLRETAQTLFQLPAAGFTSGWIKVEGAYGLSGFAVYADMAANGAAAVPALAGGSTSLLFSHIADLPPWWTGVALLNDSGSTADAEVSAMTPDGTLIGNARFTIPPGRKTARLLSEWIPQTQTRQTDGGFVFIRATNSVPIMGLELFFSRDSAVLSNVPATAPAQGLNYIPPPAP